MKILVIEDEKKTAAYLLRGLTETGFVVDLASDGENGLHLASTGNYDLLILDIMLPLKDGWSVISELRNRGNNTLTLFLSARGDVLDRVKGLELGADGYLVKPFAFSELVALIRSLLRRGTSRNQRIVQVGDLKIDWMGRRAVRGDRTLELTQKEFQLLGLLARREGEVLSRTFIAEQVWDMNFDSDTNVVDVHINRLRSKVDVGFPQKLIHTIRGMGYVLREDTRNTALL
jgi:two-component system copper resistance phosphate regulon response regulator CusR